MNLGRMGSKLPLPYPMAITTLRPLRPRRAILLRKDAQLGLFGGETEVKPTAAAKRRERMLQPKAPPKPPKPSTRATAPKEGDTRINRAGNEEVLRAGRWRLASNPKVVAKDRGSAAIVPVVEAEKPMPEMDEDAIGPAVEEPMVEAKQNVSAEEAMMQRYAAPDVTYTSDGPTQGFPGGYDESFARKTVRSLKTRLDLLRSSEAIARRNAKYSPKAYAESYEKHQRTKQAFLSSLTPLDDRLIDLLPPENTKRQVEIDKKIVEEWMDLNPVRVSADYVRVLAAMTPEEVIKRNMRSVPNQTLSDEFAKYAVRSGLYWTDSRTGGSFQLGPDLTRELKLADRAKRIFGISVAETPDDRGQINKPAAKPKSRRKPVEPEPTAVPAEVIDDAPKPTKLGDRIRAIANDLRDENDEQKKIAARILGAAAQMAQNYDNLVGEVVDMVGEDLGEDIRSLNPDATQADVEMVARDGGNEPPPTRLADKMKAIANDLRNETNEQVKATARILDAAAQIAQNYDNLVDEVAEMVGEDLEAGGGAISPAVEEPMVEAEESQKEKFERIYSLSTGKRLRALNELPNDEWQAYSEWEKNKGNETASPPEPQEKSEPVAEEEKDDLLSDPFAADISLSMARQAHAGTSFDPDKRGEDEVRDYVQHLRAVQNSLNNIAETPEQQALAAAEFDRYRQGYQRRYTDSLARRGRIVSPMIVGPARFPVDQMEKRRSSYERSINELLEWSDRAQNAAKKAVLAAAPGGDPTAPISSDDPDAIKKLQAQIDAAEKRQAAMKAGNKIVVDKTLTDGQKLAKLIELGIEKSDAEYALRRDGTDSRPYGFQRFQFSNNSANIRRMKQRIVTLEKKRSQSTRSITVGDIKITDDVEANRLRLVFPGKPSSEVRDKLKRSGFRWSPKEGAWQRMRSNDAIYAAEQALGIKLTKSLPPGPVFTLMGAPYIFDPNRAVLRKAGTSWEQFVADLSKEADDDPCWKGYEAVGMKKKRGKMVPNCVPIN